MEVTKVGAVMDTKEEVEDIKETIVEAIKIKEDTNLKIEDIQINMIIEGKAIETIADRIIDIGVCKEPDGSEGTNPLTKYYKHVIDLPYIRLNCILNEIYKITF